MKYRDYKNRYQAAQVEYYPKDEKRTNNIDNDLKKIIRDNLTNKGKIEREEFIFKLRTEVLEMHPTNKINELLDNMINSGEIKNYIELKK